MTQQIQFIQQHNATKAFRLAEKTNEDVPRRFNCSMLTKTLHIHHQHINSAIATRALFPAALGARRSRIFHAANKLATRTHVKRKKVTTKVAETIAKVYRKARSRTSKHYSRTIRAIRLNTTTTSD